MTESDAARAETLARLAESRAEICRVLEPPRASQGTAPGGTDGEPPGGAHAGQFPRSRTMKLLLSGRGIGTVGAVVGGLVLARPALALRVLRMVPAGAVARMLLVKAITSFRGRHS